MDGEPNEIRVGEPGGRGCWAEAQSAAFGRHPLASGLHSAFFSATSLDLALQSTPFEQKDSVSLLFLLDFSYSVTLACSLL
ncbi:hypothetical protein OPV22_013585 [Ensete ventricosum]|uniref:Uncharacterized protein n=1 Tax=Ensete ventricosum TaxID=4639 RepID=A0AAV8R183_ENSVE|nr:hypothetical protein OPV22_013585 [Ensete ventricosum]